MRIIPLVEAGRKIHISVQKLKNEKFYIQHNIETVMDRYSKYQTSLDNILKEL